MAQTPAVELDCAKSSTYCRDAFDVVAIEPTDPMGDHPEVTRAHLDGWQSMARVPGSRGGTQCAVLNCTPGDGNWRSTIYDDPSEPFRTLEMGSRDGLKARRAIGLG